MGRGGKHLQAMDEIPTDLLDVPGRNETEGPAEGADEEKLTPRDVL